MPAYEFFTDEQLSKAARDGDEAAWEALIRRHGQRLLAFFQRMLGGDGPLARELFIQAWSDLARLRPSLASGGRFATSAFALAVKLAWQAKPTAPPPAGFEDPTSLPSRSRRLFAALSKLTPLERAALCLCYFDNLSFAEASRALGGQPEGVRQSCAEGWATLAKELGPGFLSVEP